MDQRSGIQIDPQRGEPIYKQICYEIRRRILGGTYPAGYRLPPARLLARELSTHRNTVARAFDELEAAGLVHSIVGRGTFVSAPPDAAQPAAGRYPGQLPWSSLISDALTAEPLSRLDRLVHTVLREDLINLTGMYPSADLLPADLLRRCLDHVLRTQGPKSLGYSPRQGVLHLRELIAQQLSDRHIPVGADDIIVTTGSQQALDLIARALVNPGETLLVDEFTYTGALTAFAAAGARVVGVPADDRGPDLDALRRLARDGAKAFYVMPNCSNPTGMSITLERRKELVEWSHAAGVAIIEDDYGAELNLDGGPTPAALRGLDRDVLYVSTFSKRLIPALRVGYVVCPPALRRQLVALKHSMDLGTSTLMQLALAEFIRRGYLRSHLRRLLPQYRARRDALEAALRAHLPAEVSWQRPRQGVFLWLRLPAALDPEVVFDEAQRQGVLVSPGTLHSVYRPSQGGLRLTFCAEPPERLADGAQRLAKAIEIVAARVGTQAAAAVPGMEGV